MKTKYILLAAGAAAVVCLCCFGAIFGLNLMGGIGVTQPVADAGESFMQSLQVGDYARAYAWCHPSLQQKIGNAQSLKTMVEQARVQPLSWSFTSRYIENNTGHMEGAVIMRGGDGKVLLEFVKVNGEWRILSFDLKPR